MSATIHALDCGKHQILALDADEQGRYLALLDHGEVWSNDWRLPLKRRFHYPLIRRINAERFLLLEQRRGPRANAFIFSAAGEQLLAFDAGDAVEDVVVQAGCLVVSYFDQAAGQPPPAGDGLAVFDLQGQQLFGYNTSGRGGFILDCYALCPHGPAGVLFYAYTDFQLQELRLTDFHLQRWPTPPAFRGAHALTASHGNVVFWGSYEDQTGFYWWNRRDKVRRFGHVPLAPARGIGNGKFLTHDARSFTIIDALELMRQKALQGR
jgi:hypothetical protein